MSGYTIIVNDALEALRGMESESVDCIITSPPYYALRDYGVDGQIGLEETPEEYIAKLVGVFHEAKRVLKNSGTLWVNIGDSYCGSGKGGANYPDNAAKYKQGTNRGSVANALPQTKGAKPKDLIGIPWMLAFALRDDGWYLRQDIIWAKTNCMPESVRDRCTKSHEYIFLMAKSKKYYFDADAIKEEADEKYANRYKYSFMDNEMRHGAGRPKDLINTPGKKTYSGKRNKRDVWQLSCGSGYKASNGYHFATFPEKLITPCVLAGCPAGGVVLDPFCGAATTGVAALRNGRDFVGIELNPEYAKMSIERLETAAEDAQCKLF